MSQKGCKTCGKYKYKSGTRKIETEGREPVFDSKGKLIYYNPSDPTHSEGGVKAVVVPKDTYSTNQLQAINKTSSTKIFPEGSSIVTAQKGKAQEALIAYRNGNKSLLNKVIKSMPEDKVNSYKGGSKSVKGEDFDANYSSYKSDTGFSKDGFDYKNIDGKVNISPTGKNTWTRPNESQYNAFNKQYFNNRLGAYKTGTTGSTNTPTGGSSSMKGYRVPSKGYNVTPQEITDNQNKQAAYDASMKYSLTPEQSKEAAAKYANPEKESLQDKLKNKGYPKGTGIAAGLPAYLYNRMMGKQTPDLVRSPLMSSVQLPDKYNTSAMYQSIKNSAANQLGVANQNAGTPTNRIANATAINNKKSELENNIAEQKNNYINDLKGREIAMNSAIGGQNVNIKISDAEKQAANNAAGRTFNMKNAENLGTIANNVENNDSKKIQNQYNYDMMTKYFNLKEKGLEGYKAKGDKSLKLKPKKSK